MKQRRNALVLSSMRPRNTTQKERKNLTCSPSSVIQHATASYDQPEKEKDVATRTDDHSASVWISRKTHLSCDVGKRINGSHEQLRQRNFVDHALLSLMTQALPLSPPAEACTPFVHIFRSSREYKNRRFAQSSFITSSSNSVECPCPR